MIFGILFINNIKDNINILLYYTKFITIFKKNFMKKDKNGKTKNSGGNL